MQVDLIGPDTAPTAAVLLHPHPHFGGDRYHPFIDGVFHRLASKGRGAARFDFSSADPETACEEIRMAVSEACDRWSDARIVLAGYSFGAGMAARVDDPTIAGWFLLAPPQTTLGDATIGHSPRPKRIVVPEHDQYSSPEGVGERTAEWHATEVRTIPGDHYLAVSLVSVVGDCVEFACQLG